MKRRAVGLVLLLLGACRGLQPLPPPQAPEPGRDTPVRGEASPPETTAGAPTIPDDHSALLARELRIPVQGVRGDQVQDTFRARRGDRIHAALDIMAPRGTPVLAADGGLLWKVRSNALGGLTVYVLDDERRFVYYYAHLDRYADETREGRRVAKGTVLGFVGTTGNAPPNVPHLHFQVMKYRGDGRWWDGEPINPFPYLTATPRGTR